MKIGSLEVDASGTQFADVKCPHCGDTGSYAVAGNAAAIECRTCSRPSPFKAPAIDVAAPRVGDLHNEDGG